jgi:hypothetical protein
VQPRERTSETGLPMQSIRDPVFAGHIIAAAVGKIAQKRIRCKFFATRGAYPAHAVMIDDSADFAIHDDLAFSHAASSSSPGRALAPSTSAR